MLNRGDLVREPALKDALTALDRKLAALPGEAGGGRGGRAARGGGSREPTFRRVQGDMGQLLKLLQRADAAPTSQLVVACAGVQKTFSALRERWHELGGKELRNLNEKLRNAKLPQIK